MKPLLPNRIIKFPAWWDKMKIASINIFLQNDKGHYIYIYIKYIFIGIYTCIWANVT